MVAHFIDYDFRQRTRLLALRTIIGAPTGETVSWHLAKVIGDYDLEDRLG